MRSTITFVFVTLLLLSGLARSEEFASNQAIAEIQKRMVGEWRLVSGVEGAELGSRRVWSFGEDAKLQDSEEELGMTYHLVQTASGEIWMLMLYAPSSDSPMVMQINIEGDSLTLNYVGKTKEGAYGAQKEGGLTFKKDKENKSEEPTPTRRLIKLGVFTGAASPITFLLVRSTDAR